ncbi:hypothetical protein FVEN_g851 [Fusarium venenatum]|uniref:Zn(2)-C6 fungal-type domain-containing protein n=1 Tax=Fusarium venenatum TaxID=56646 RepID=A0A2L2TI59_9HYPO|nr:uncharacterized protein FVRRES_10739 [Fusarium venenatum]KAG8361617.1 hypothetical protein FVEN_g851 [Fusarium venenatum]CEI70662.1 unnamed protein product [Fusarium venenatum]
MPVIRRIPDNKRRSRTGCIPCRRRRRKCDEQRPQCGSCQGRNVTCEFKEWTFVPGVRSSLRRDDCARDDTRGDTPEESDSLLPMQDSFVSFIDDSPSTLDPVLASPLPSTVRSDRIDSTQNTTTNTSQPTTITSTHHHPNNEGNQIPTPARWNETVLSEQNSSERQTAMLRFRYQIVPWLDSNAPRSSFGPKIMTLAAEKSVIMDVIVWVAMRRSRASTVSEGDFHLVQHLQHRLSLESAFTADVGRSLLALGNFFYTSPSEWANLHPDRSFGEDRYQFFENQEEPLKTLDRFHFKAELAASIVASRSPSSRPSVSLMDEALLSPSMSPCAIYDTCLAHLTSCCQLIHNKVIPLLNGFTTIQSPTQEPSSLVWATWSSLWARCVQWFRDRPPDMVPLLESSEVDAHTATTTSPFTADVYSSAIAVQANLTMHYSSLLLLSYKPRLVKLSSTPHRLTSKSWHAQKLAKLALWNNFPDQWDPVVVATVVRIARDMTYPSQQEALLSCFQRIGDATKIPLQREITDLQQFWSSSRHSNAPTNLHS